MNFENSKRKKLVKPTDRVNNLKVQAYSAENGNSGCVQCNSGCYNCGCKGKCAGTSGN